MDSIEIDVATFVLGGLGFVATTVMGVLVWFVKRMVDSFDSLKDEFHNFKKEVTTKYAKKEEVQKDLAHILDKISLLVSQNSQQIKALALEMKEDRVELKEYVKLLAENSAKNNTDI